VAGHGWTCDAHHATAPDPSGERIIAAMRRAMERADVRADDVGVVVPHATGTPLSDVTESTALGAVLGDRLGEVPVYSTKAALGHTGAASGLLSAIAALEVLRHGVVPPNIAVKEPDPDCPVWVPSEEVSVRGSHALVNAFAFGGHNICLVLAPAEDRP
jgi:3-oxoacyl-(acyl-carrier-protein) synthase